MGQGTLINDKISKTLPRACLEWQKQKVIGPPRQLIRFAPPRRDISENYKSIQIRENKSKPNKSIANFNAPRPQYFY